MILYFIKLGRPCEEIAEGVLTKGFSMVLVHQFLVFEDYLERIAYMVEKPDKAHWFYEGVTCDIGAGDD